MDFENEEPDGKNILSEEIASFSQVDYEINDSLNELIIDDAPVNSELELNGEEIDDVLSVTEEYLDDNSEYDIDEESPEDLEPISSKCFNIKLGTDSVPRYSCACHKANIAVRKAIKKCPSLCKNLAKLSRFAAKIRRSNILSKIFQLKKTRLRCECLTRWSSSVLMLLQFFKAYINNCFNGSQCFLKK